MSFVSPDNQQLTSQVARIRAGYANFQTALRGAAAVLLTGLGNGTHNLVSMNNALDTIAQDYLDAAREQVLEDLGNVSASSLKTSRSESSPDISTRALSVADALHRGFAADVERSVERAVAKDVKTTLEFVRTQVMQGRFVATSEQLVHDLKFTVTGKMTLDSDEFVRREVNWAYRQQYNTIMVHVLLAREVDEARIDGGSSDGQTLDLMVYDQLQPKFFHHNSKSLLQPLDVGI
ncbi:MAG: hypothetical protein RR740_00090 [Pseudomonas sp.]